MYERLESLCLLVILQEDGSDSAMLDNALELLVQCGRSPLAAMAMMVPEAYEGNKIMDSKLRSFYDYQVRACVRA